MKLMICANLGVGGLPSIDLPSARIGQWEKDKVRVLSMALKDAVNRGAEACVIAGGIFVRDFVAQSLVASTMEALGSCNLPVCYVPFPVELAGIGGHLSAADSIQVIATEANASMGQSFKVLGHEIAVVTRTGLEDLKDVPRPSGVVTIVRSGDEVGVVLDRDSEPIRVGPLATSSFGEPLGSGYMLVDVGDTTRSVEWIGLAVHPFVVSTIKLNHPRSTRELVTTIGEAVKEIDRNACLRVELSGLISLGTHINSDELADQLGAYFYYVEVADECELDINTAELDADVSLLAEFIRKVTADDSLSLAEKTRILRCGWNVLNGKELAE